MGHGVLHIVSHRGVHTVAHNAIPGAGLGVDFLMLWEGLSSMGGLLGGIVAAVVWFRRKNIRFAEYSDAFALGRSA